MSIEQDLETLNIQLRVLASNLETEREKFTEIMTNQIKAIEAQFKEISDTNTMLQSIPKKIDVKLEESASRIASDLSTINEKKLKKLEEEYLKATEKHAELFTSSEIKLNQLVEKLNSIDSRKLKRFFLGVIFAVFISVFASVSASYLMMRSFPLKAIINHPENIILNESQVSLWGTDNVKVLKNTKN